jgi:phosphatidylinositol alpha-1,6-mannosyltransferase
MRRLEPADAPPSAMRVLYLTDSLSDLDGVGRYAVRLLTALQEIEPGLEVRVLLARKHRPTSAETPAHWKIDVALPPDYFYYMAPSRFWPSLAAGTWRTWRAARSCDLVHAIKDHPHSLVAVLGARLAGVPCVSTAHGTYSVLPLLDARHARLARWAYARLAALISVSRYTASRLQEIWRASGRSPLPIEIVPNAVDAGKYRAERNLSGVAWQGLRFTLSIGELKERKGHHLALGAWCRLAPRWPDLHHFIVGKRTGDAYQRRLEAMVRESGLEQRVHFLGNVDEESKVDLLQRAEVFLHTPVTAADGGFEGFGIVYLEAAASGTPSLGTLGCGAEDAIEDGRTGLLVAPNEAAVEAGLRRLLEDEALRAMLGAAGRERAQQSPWIDNARRVLGLYRAALARGGR